MTIELERNVRAVPDFVFFACLLIELLEQRPLLGCCSDGIYVKLAVYCVHASQHEQREVDLSPPLSSR